MYYILSKVQARNKIFPSRNNSIVHTKGERLGFSNQDQVYAQDGFEGINRESVH